jgi:hypothetical protein
VNADRPPGLFRGSELPRLLILAALMLAGWAAVLTWPRPAAEPPPKPAASTSPLPPPDDSPPFQGIRDKTAMSPRDNAAYAALLERVRRTPYPELAAQSRHDVLFSQLIEDPGRYRGLPIHVEGTALRVIRQDVKGSQIYPDGVYYEAYAVSSDSQGHPWVLAFEQAPDGLAIGDNINQRISFDGYFLKLWAYEAGDRFRFAPLLIGRFPPASNAAPVLPTAGLLLERLWPFLLLLVITLYVGIRLALRLRKTTRPIPRPPGKIAVSDQIDPDRLTAWIEGRSDDQEDAEDEPGA